MRFVNNNFSETQKSTVQANFFQKDFKLQDKTVSLSVWDTAGQERFHALGPIYYRNASGALLVYDVTDHDSFVRAQNWVQELRKIEGDDIILTIVGNKCDLKERQITEEEINEFIKQANAHHFYTSAKVDKGVEEAFTDLVTRILQLKDLKSKNKLTKSSFVKPKTIKIEEEKETNSDTNNGGCTC
jgi:Ras-related protein Rab-21